MFFFVFGLIELKASPQSPDFLIIGKDTISIYHLPLHHLDSLTLKTFFTNLQSDTLQFGFSFNLWRGYQAYWQLVDNKLYLVGIKGYSNADSILKETFPEYYSNRKVFAYWFSSYLSVGRDKMLKWDGIFSRTYFRDEIFEFSNGLLTERKIVDNYIDLKNGISRLDRKVVIKTIFKQIKKLNWKYLSECDCDDKYIITINENGKISNVEVAPIYETDEKNRIFIEDHKICIEKFSEQLNDLQFDIIRWNGKPYNEKIVIELFYDKKLENWTE